MQIPKMVQLAAAIGESQRWFARSTSFKHSQCACLVCCSCSYACY